MDISLHSLTLKLVAGLLLGKLGSVALDYYDAMRSSDPCYTVESPDSHIVFETFPDFRLFAMPGDGGCHDSFSTIRLRTASGKLIRQEHADTFDLRLDWEMEYDAVRVSYFDETDKYEWWLWDRSEKTAKPADYLQRRLNMMVENGDTASIDRMLRDGAKLDNIDQDGKLPLVLAAGSGDEALVKHLLDAGANVNRADGSGSTALHSSQSDSRDTAVSGITKLLVERGASINARDSFGETPLARGMRNLLEVAYFVDHGADVTAVSNDGRPVIASYVRDPKIFSYLLQHGATVDYRAHWLPRAIYDAALDGNVEMLRFFESHGADIRAGLGIRNELVPLAQAIRLANFDLVVFLVEHNVDMNEVDPTSGKRIPKLLQEIRNENHETREECEAANTQGAFDCDFGSRLERIEKYLKQPHQGSPPRAVLQRNVNAGSTKNGRRKEGEKATSRQRRTTERAVTLLG